jgi:hypothetical protein
MRTPRRKKPRRPPSRPPVVTGARTRRPPFHGPIRPTAAETQPASQSRTLQTAVPPATRLQHSHEPKVALVIKNRRIWLKTEGCQSPRQTCRPSWTEKAAPVTTPLRAADHGLLPWREQSHATRRIDRGSAGGDVARRTRLRRRRER